jgi:hypothetical protein
VPVILLLIIGVIVIVFPLSTILVSLVELEGPDVVIIFLVLSKAIALKGIVLVSCVDV